MIWVPGVSPYSYELLWTELKGLIFLVFLLKVCGSEHLTSNAKFIQCYTGLPEMRL